MENKEQQFHPPNHQIFEKYGTLDNSKSKLNQCQVLIARHALSNYNHQNSEFNQKYQNESEEAKLQLKLELYCQRDLIDPNLHPKGVIQAISQQPIINMFTYRVVFVSPHRRAIETAVNLLGSHPHKELITLTLLPLAKEILNNSNDIVVDYQHLKEFLENIKITHKLDYDLSYFDAFQNPNHWYFEILTNEKKRINLLQQAESLHHHEVTLKTIRENNLIPIESRKEVFERIQKLKQFLNDFIFQMEKPLDNKEKILLITHSTVMQAFFSDGFDEISGNYINMKHPHNCEIIPYHNETI